MDLTTPALLFPAISLLLLAYTSRFVVLTNVIRQLAAMPDAPPDLVARQIDNLGGRLRIIKWMQGLGVASFICCSLSMLFLFLGSRTAAHWAFGISLGLLVASLVCSLLEVQRSTHAIEVEIQAFRDRTTQP